MSRVFASPAERQPKPAGFERLSVHAWADTA
jgi:hypothetical protein